MRSGIKTTRTARSSPKTDIHLADAIRKTILSLNEPDIHFSVTDGSVCLNGTVNFDYERKEAEAAVGKIKGVKGMVNKLKIKPLLATSSEINKRIAAKFHHNASRDASNISVEVVLYQVRLTGKVRSFMERKDAEDVARSIPGIVDVQNEIQVEEQNNNSLQSL
jgi:osmotically-inducible protein OsmY